MKWILPILLLAALPANTCCAQQAKKAETHLYDFTPGESVIFEDDFSNDVAGAFPSRWHTAPCHSYFVPDQDDTKCCVIQKEDNTNVLFIQKTSRYIDPDMNERYYLHDSFAVEFDFVFASEGCAELRFYPYENLDSCVSVCFHVLSTGVLRRTTVNNEYLGSYPAAFNAQEWHHFALSYNKRAVAIYIDKYRIAFLPDCKFSPYGASLGCIAPVTYKHFKITAGKENNAFAAMLTEKKFVTHAINFDVNKATIKPESAGFMTQLAQFLKANPSVKFEIDGHTDSDGDATANMKLSQERADEVKRQLVSLGISSNRLFTKGFGATKPIQPNTTPEGKADNRRVEFIKR